LGWGGSVVPSIPILDAHIHLFDTWRPGGVPWPEKSDPVIFKPALPDRYASIAGPLGVVGAIAIEASPLASDNDWVLKLAADQPIIVGMIGDLVPGVATYSKELERLNANPLFLGIRCGNLWNRDLAADVRNPDFIAGLKALSHAGLTLDTANPDPALISAIVIVADKVPELRIVIDHLPHAEVPTEPVARRQYNSNLSLLGKRPNIFVKLSEIPEQKGQSVPKDPAFYKEKLDAIWEIFGENRILYGSDWPNSGHLASYADTLSIVRGYMSAKTPSARQKLFWKNSIAAYKWRPRKPNQHTL
jgi:L-fuconolactonase